MTLLSHEIKLSDGKLVARFLCPLTASEATVVCIPGGPGLGSSYLDPFMIQLSERAFANVGILDLPNHGASPSLTTGTPLSYQQCSELVTSAISELLKSSARLFLFGQSFGARLAFDALPYCQNLAGAMLTGFPFAFEMSNSLIEKLGQLDLADLEGAENIEEVFAANWKKIFPFYTPRPLDSATAQAMASGTRWKGNEQMLQEVPSIEDTLDRLTSLEKCPPILVLEGDEDWVVPDDNREILQALLPDADFRILRGVGHFAMVESPDEVLSAFSSFIEENGAAW